MKLLSALIVVALLVVAVAASSNAESDTRKATAEVALRVAAASDLTPCSFLLSLFSAGKAYLETNAKADGVTVLPSGLQYKGQQNNATTS